jgi:HSP20 family protein
VSWNWRRDELEELFSELTQPGASPLLRRAFRPAVDVFRSDDPPTVTVVADLAGVDAGDIRLSLADGVLTIAGVRRRQSSEQALYERMELDYGPFERLVAVGDEVDAESAEAVVERGMLTVRFRRRVRPSRPVRVVISVVRRP